MIRGMTGFGRAQGQGAWGAWSWEARSVNGKAVDLRTNFPPGCEAVDFEARRRVKERFQRGSFQLQLKIDWTRDPGANSVDTRELARLVRLSRHWSRTAGVAPARIDGLIAVAGAMKGVSRTGTSLDEAVSKDLLTGLDKALDMLGAARGKEGESLLALFNGMSALENILLGRHVHLNPGVVKTALYWWLSQPEEISHRRLCEETIEFLQLQGVRDEPVETLPIGLKKRVELARALVAEPTFLILDEPMAGMNQEEKEYMARFILDARDERGITVLLIEHDMGMVMDISSKVVVLNFGQVIGTGTPDEVRANPEVIRAYLGGGHEKVAA